MNAEELKAFLEYRGYIVKRIRVFAKSFHVNVHTPTEKLVCYYKVPLSSVPKQNDGSRRWFEFSRHYPKVEAQRGNKK